MLVRADLHIHSCLSPCGSLEMSPGAIINQAKKMGLDLICLSDHNAPFNIPAMHDLAMLEKNITVFYGIEVTTLEEVHCLIVFDDFRKAYDFGNMIYSIVLNIRDSIHKNWDQVYVDKDENILGEAEKYLGVSANISFEGLLFETKKEGGLFIPAHVDRPAFSLISQLGFIPDGDYDALEFSKYHYKSAVARPKGASKYTAITNSDAHYIDDIGTSITIYNMDDMTLASLSKALISRQCKIELSM